MVKKGLKKGNNYEIRRIVNEIDTLTLPGVGVMGLDHQLLIWFVN